MPIDATKIPSHLIDAAADGRLALLVGAGLSKQAESAQSDILPNWPELLRELISIGIDADGLTKKDEDLIESLILRER